MILIIKIITSIIMTTKSITLKLNIIVNYLKIKIMLMWDVKIIFLFEHIIKGDSRILESKEL